VKIGICVKFTPDTDSRVKAADGNLDLSEAKWVVSAYDVLAVEEAVATRERLKGGEVISLSVGADSNLAALRQGVLAVGADRAVLVSDPAALATDALGVAKVLAAAARQEGLQVLFCGKVANDSGNSQVPAMVAELLGWPQVNRVVKFETDGSTFRATRSVDGGVNEVVEGALPVVLTTEPGLNKPRSAKLPDIMKANKKSPAKPSLADLGLTAADLDPKVRHFAWSPPPARPKGRLLTGDVDAQVSELVRLLRDEAKVL
jgi:electron transfer flavoprotein beta subunit